MRYYDEEECKRENVQPWQKELLKMNPSYNSWGCYEDYMCEDDAGWRSRSILSSIEEMWKLDDLNECVDFYFEVFRKSHECPTCGGEGLNPETKQIYDDWYDFAGTGRRWCDDINDEEVKALVRAGRIQDVSGFRGYYKEEDSCWYTWKDGEKVVCDEPSYPSAEEVNIWNRDKNLGHDAINRSICCRARAESLGVYGPCPECEDGRVYEEETPHVALQLWILHPRKGCSKGVYIENITQEDLPRVFAFLREARDRNRDRFSKIPD